jgi:hypothetical protein
VKSCRAASCTWRFIDPQEPLSDWALAASGKASATARAKIAERWFLLEDVVRRGGTNGLQHAGGMQLRFA